MGGSDMNEKLYDLMNWREIEGIVYSDTCNPYEVLGQHIVKDGVLIGAFSPDSSKLEIKDLSTGKVSQMEKVDDAGFYAILLPGKKRISYKLIGTFEDGDTFEYYDPYAFGLALDEAKLRKFNAGICYDAYDYLGAHEDTVDGVKGVRFAVWAPYAYRVSVVGEFNNWDGRIHQMTKIDNTGVFEIFVPEIGAGEMYKFEIRKKGELLSSKYDPYSFMTEKLPGLASIVANLDNFKWTDGTWLTNRAKNKSRQTPLSIGEVMYDEYTDEVIDKVVKDAVAKGYTHIKLVNITAEKQPKTFFAPDPKKITPDKLMKLVDTLHNEGVGVIMDIQMHHFSSEQEGLAEFDGSCLYEHDDMKKGYLPKHNTKLFNYARPEVTSFLISSVLFWTHKYHMDGISIATVAGMLYLDYDKKNGEWTPNIYGGNENLEAIELIKHLNSIYKKMSNGAILIAEDNSGYQNLTGDEVTSDCLGFDYKYNVGWRRDLLDYLQYEPYMRTKYYNELTLNSVYTFNDNFILPLTHDMVEDGKPVLKDRMTGVDDFKRMANLRLALAYYMTYPGKKALYLNTEQEQLSKCISALNKMYKSEPALYELDDDEEGFEWINNISAKECVITYVRKGKTLDEMLLVACNFEDIDREEYKVGVLRAGKYKEIFNSDSEEFGGKGFTNKRLKQSKTDECDGREESIRIRIPALGVTVLKFSRADQKLTTNKAAKEAKKAEPAKKTTTAKTTTAKTATAKTTTAKTTTAKAAATKKTTSKKTTKAAAKATK